MNGFPFKSQPVILGLARALPPTILYMSQISWFSQCRTAFSRSSTRPRHRVSVEAPFPAAPPRDPILSLVLRPFSYSCIYLPTSAHNIAAAVLIRAPCTCLFSLLLYQQWGIPRLVFLHPFSLPRHGQGGECVGGTQHQAH